jgi:hypothetical protein
MAKDLSGINEYPHSDTSSSVTGAEVLTIDPGRASLVLVYIDASDGGTLAVGTGGAAVPIAGEQWVTAWTPGPTSQRASTISVTPTTGSTDIHFRVH